MEASFKAKHWGDDMSRWLDRIGCVDRRDYPEALPPLAEFAGPCIFIRNNFATASQ
jgi:hypothetical protein